MDSADLHSLRAASPPGSAHRATAADQHPASLRQERFRAIRGVNFVNFRALRTP